MSAAVNCETQGFKENIAQQIEMKRAGRRKHVHHGGTVCSGCYAEPPLPGQRYGKNCRNKASLASYYRKQDELKRLRALVSQGENHAEI